MAISEFETKRVEKLVGQFVEMKRPPGHVRNELDISFRISGQSFEIFTPALTPISSAASSPVDTVQA